MTDVIEGESAVPPAKVSPPLSTQPVSIDAQCVGDRWAAHDGTSLAKLIAIIAMGQAAYAAYILRDLLPATPAFSDADLSQEARVRMTVQDDVKTPRTGYPRWQRDGFIFEAISWIAARQVYGTDVLLKDPHVSATSQGLDGLMIELADDKSKVVMTTIFEDKCTDDPRNTFLQKVIPAFLDRHKNKRSAELVGLGRVIGEDDIVLKEEYAYPCYGVPSEETNEAIRLAARSEGMMTDPVYEGKSMQGLIDLTRKGFFTAGSKVLYAHLGGVPAINGYSYIYRNG